MSISNKDLFELFKQGKIHIIDIPNPTEDMIWWAIKNNRVVPQEILTDDMIIYLIEHGKSFNNISRLNNIEITEASWIEYIKHKEPYGLYTFGDKLIQYLIESPNLTESIALELCVKVPYYYTNQTISKLITEYKKQDISDVFFKGLEDNTNWSFQLPAELPISDEQWQWLLDNGKIAHANNGIKTYITERDNVPDFVRHKVLEKKTYLSDWGKFSADDLVVWITAHRNELDTDYGCKDTIKYYLKCDEMDKVLSKCGWFIKYLKNQPFNLCKAAIDCDPSNIQYVKKPSKKLIEYALSIDKSVTIYVEDKTKEAISKKYPADKYLIKIIQDICDEGELVRVCVIKGKDMERFMSTTTSLSFGNLDDDIEYTIGNIASYTPITDSELEVIRKLGLIDIKSGYFRNIGHGDFDYVK